MHNPQTPPLDCSYDYAMSQQSSEFELQGNELNERNEIT